VIAEDRARDPEQADELLDAKQVAALMKVHVATVYRLADSGLLKAMRLGKGEKRRRGFRCWASDAHAYMHGSQISPTEEVA
jgi:excisionase family DNA binding protein